MSKSLSWRHQNVCDLEERPTNVVVEMLMQMKREQARWCQCKLALFPTTLKERQTKPTTLYPLFVTQPWDDVRVTKPWDDMRPPSISSVRRSVASLWWYRPWNRHPSTTNQVTSHQMGGKVYRRINSWRIDSNMDWVSTGPCRTTYHFVICMREPVQKPSQPSPLGLSPLLRVKACEDGCEVDEPKLTSRRGRAEEDELYKPVVKTTRTKL